MIRAWTTHLAHCRAADIDTRIWPAVQGVFAVCALIAALAFALPNGVSSHG